MTVVAAPGTLQTAHELKEECVQRGGSTGYFMLFPIYFILFLLFSAFMQPDLHYLPARG